MQVEGGGKVEGVGRRGDTKRLKVKRRREREIYIYIYREREREREERERERKRKCVHAHYVWAHTYGQSMDTSKMCSIRGYREEPDICPCELRKSH
jgi:hypothetical protein